MRILAFTNASSPWTQRGERPLVAEPAAQEQNGAGGEHA